MGNITGRTAVRVAFLVQVYICTHSPQIRPYPFPDFDAPRKSLLQVSKPAVKFDSLPHAAFEQVVLALITVTRAVENDRDVEDCTEPVSNYLRFDIVPIKTELTRDALE